MAKPAKLATTTFATAPDDALATVDVYETTEMVDARSPLAVAASNVGNVLSDAASDAKTIVGDKLSASGKALTGIKALVKDGIKKKKFDSAAAKELLKGVKGSVNINDLKGRVAGDLLRAVGYQGDVEALLSGKGGLPDKDTVIMQALGDNPKLQVLYKGVVKVKNTADLKDTKGIAAALNGFANDPELMEVLDMDSTLGALASLSSTAYRAAQLTEVFEEALATLKNDDERRALCRRYGLEPFWLGDKKGVDQCMAYVSSAEMLAKYPDAVATFLQAYRLPEGEHVPTLALNADLLATLTRIDPLWASYKRGSQTVSNLEVFTRASPDALGVLMFTHRTQVMLAKSYPTEKLTSLAKRSYPRAAL